MAWRSDIEAQLDDAFYAQDFDRFKFLLKEHRDNICTEAGEHRWLIDASEEGYFDLVKFLVQDIGIRPDYTTIDIYGNSLLACTEAAKTALAYGHDDIAVWLLDQGAQINVNRNGHKDSPLLTMAVRHNNLEMVKLLIERGADVNACGGSCRNAFMMARTDEIREFLRSKGGIDLREVTPPDYAASHCCILDWFDTWAESDGAWGDRVDWQLHFPGNPSITMYCREPGENRDSRLLMTVGMSDVMLREDGFPYGVGLELILSLPPDWQLPTNDEIDSPAAVPMVMLDQLARSILSKGEKSHPYQKRDLSRAAWSLEMSNCPSTRLTPRSDFSAWLILGHDCLTMPDCRDVFVEEAVPIYPEEADYLLAKMDYQSLLLRFNELGILRQFELNRPNAITDWPKGQPEPEPEVGEWCVR